MEWTARDGVEELAGLSLRISFRARALVGRGLEWDQLLEADTHLRRALACLERAAGQES